MVFSKKCRVLLWPLPNLSLPIKHCRYKTHHNFFCYGGHKSDFDGHGKLSYNNINAYSLVYGPKCISLMDLPLASPDGHYNEGYYNNT